MIFIYYSYTYLFILFVIIIKDNQWMLYPFICITYIYPPEMGTTTSHEISLVEFTKTFKINLINNLSLCDYQSSVEKSKHLQLYPQILFFLKCFLLLLKCKLDRKFFKWIIWKIQANLSGKNFKRNCGRLRFLWNYIRMANETFILNISL